MPKQYELILVNDGSTNGSDRVLERIITDHAGKIKVGTIYLETLGMLRPYMRDWSMLAATLSF